MATKIPAIIRVRRGTSDQWNTANPVLQEGEIGYISSGENAGYLKVGDGINTWQNLTLTVGVATWGGINGFLSNQADLQNVLDNTNSLIVDLESIVNAWIGRGGYLEAYDFGTATPTQEDLTNEALAQITTITDPVDIFNGTKIKNLNNGDVWILTNTQDTDPVVFEWTNQGPDSIQQFGLNTGGYIKGADPVSDGNGFIQATPDGKGKVIGFPNLDYSTVEQDTGRKWVDGKTIYQKTWTGSITFSGGQTKDVISINNIYLTDSHGLTIINGGQVFVPFSQGTISASSVAIRYTNNSNGATHNLVALTARYIKL